MRAIVFYLHFIFLLFFGSQNFYAHSHQDNLSYYSSQNPAEKFVLKTNSKPFSVFISDTGFDLEEDCNNSNETKKKNDTPVSQKYNLVINRFRHHSVRLITNHYSNPFNHPATFCVPASPIYITQRVLRI